MSHRNLLSLPDNPPRFPDVLVTELGANCADPWAGSWFGRMTEQGPLNDAPTAAASDTEFHDERQLTSPLSERQPAAASIIECHESVANVNCWELRATAAKW